MPLENVDILSFFPPCHKWSSMNLGVSCTRPNYVQYSYANYKQYNMKTSLKVISLCLQGFLFQASHYIFKERCYLKPQVLLFPATTVIFSTGTLLS